MKLLELGERNVVILFIFVMSLILIGAAVFGDLSVDATLPLVATWWGAVITYYFTRKKCNV